MTKLTATQQRVMKTLAGFFNPQYQDYSLCHYSDLDITSITLNRLKDLGLVSVTYDKFIHFTDKGMEMMGLVYEVEATVAEVALKDEMERVAPMLQSACEEMVAALGEGQIDTEKKEVVIGGFIAKPMIDIMTGSIGWDIMTSQRKGLRIELPLESAAELIKREIKPDVLQAKADLESADFGDNFKARSVQWTNC